MLISKLPKPSSLLEIADKTDVMDNKEFNVPSIDMLDNNIKGNGSCISATCRGLQLTAYGYKWEYADE